MNQQQKKALNREPSLTQISKLFHLPLHQACIKLSLPKEELNRICRNHGIQRWPFSHKKKNLRKKTEEEHFFVNFLVEKQPSAPSKISKKEKLDQNTIHFKTIEPRKPNYQNYREASINTTIHDPNGLKNEQTLITQNQNESVASGLLNRMNIKNLCN